VYTMSREALLYTLQNQGEPMTETELLENLSILLGFSAEGGSIEGKCDEGSPEMEPMTAEDLDAALPLSFTAEIFAEKLLGLRRCEENIIHVEGSSLEYESLQQSDAETMLRSDVATQS